MEKLVIFEAGVSNSEGKYSKFIQSPDREKVIEYMNIMEVCVDADFEIIYLEKVFNCVSTTPKIQKRSKKQ